MTTIDRRADRPVYKQVADDLRRRIAEGEYAPGEPLPSEPMLSRQYGGISRTLVRQGLGILKGEGVIHPRHGKGWYVRGRRPVHRITATRYQAQLDRAGSHAAWPLARPDHHRGDVKESCHRTISETPADEELAHALGVPIGTMLLCRELTVSLDGVPHRTIRSFVVLNIVQEFRAFRSTLLSGPNDETWRAGTVAELATVGIWVTAVDETVTARMPTPEESARLEIEEGVPVLSVRRIMYAGTKPVETCMDVVVPADRAVLHYRTELRTRKLPTLVG